MFLGINAFILCPLCISCCNVVISAHLLINSYGSLVITVCILIFILEGLNENEARVCNTNDFLVEISAGSKKHQWRTFGCQSKGSYVDSWAKTIRR